MRVNLIICISTYIFLIGAILKKFYSAIKKILINNNDWEEKVLLLN